MKRAFLVNFTSGFVVYYTATLVGCIEPLQDIIHKISDGEEAVLNMLPEVSSALEEKFSYSSQLSDLKSNATKILGDLTYVTEQLDLARVEAIGAVSSVKNSADLVVQKLRQETQAMILEASSQAKAMLDAAKIEIKALIEQVIAGIQSIQVPPTRRLSGDNDNATPITSEQISLEDTEAVTNADIPELFDGTLSTKTSDAVAATKSMVKEALEEMLHQEFQQHKNLIIAILEAKRHFIKNPYVDADVDETNVGTDESLPESEAQEETTSPSTDLPSMEDDPAPGGRRLAEKNNLKLRNKKLFNGSTNDSSEEDGPLRKAIKKSRSNKSVHANENHVEEENPKLLKQRTNSLLSNKS